MTTFKIDINPKVLEWARTQSSYKEAEAAEVLGIDAGQYLDWERYGKEIEYDHVKKLAKLYKRQISTFFLDNVPQKVKKPTEYRNFTSGYHELSKEATLYVRRTSYYLEIYRDMADAVELKDRYQWLYDVRKKRHEDRHELLRQALSAPVLSQHENSMAAFKFWRNKFETELNIFVFQFPLKEREYDGFSYTAEGVPYAITLNSNIPDSRKVFTLFHELGHIIEGGSGICFVNNTNASNAEARCNYFAAEFLMPEAEVIPVISYSELERNARGLGVSPEAYLIRLKTLGLIEPEFYRDLKKTIQEKNDAYVKPEQTGGPTRIVTVKSQRGNKFFDFIVDQYDRGRISPSQVRDVLDIRVVGISRRDN